MSRLKYIKTIMNSMVVVSTTTPFIALKMTKKKSFWDTLFHVENNNQRDGTSYFPKGSTASVESDSIEEAYMQNTWIDERENRNTQGPKEDTYKNYLNNEVSNERDANLKTVFKQIAGEIGIERPSEITLSALEEEDSMNSWNKININMLKSHLLK